MEQADAERTEPGVSPSVGGDDRQLDPRVVPMQRVVGAVTSAVLAAVTLPAAMSAWVAGGPTIPTLLLWLLLWAAGNGLLAWHMQHWPAVEYRHTSYRVDDTGIEIRRGVFWRAVVNVPRSRVQHTDVTQGPVERRFGLGTLVVYTAGTDHAKVTLGGLAHEVALAIRERLMPGQATDAV